MGNFKNRLLLFLVPTIGTWILRILGASYRLREVDDEHVSPIQYPQGHYVFAIWHGKLLPFAYFYRRARAHAMVSLNKDGELISRTLVRLGHLQPVRGSSSRGGGAALKEMVEAVRAGASAAVTPDGPRGPNQVAQNGVLRLAQMTGRPVVPVGFAARPALRLSSWDRFLIPLPFARGCFLFGKPLKVPESCQDREMESLRLQLEQSLNELNSRAEEALREQK